MQRGIWLFGICFKLSRRCIGWDLEVPPTYCRKLEWAWLVSLFFLLSSGFFFFSFSFFLFISFHFSFRSGFFPMKMIMKILQRGWPGENATKLWHRHRRSLADRHGWRKPALLWTCTIIAQSGIFVLATRFFPLGNIYSYYDFDWGSWLSSVLCGFRFWVDWNWPPWRRKSATWALYIVREVTETGKTRKYWEEEEAKSTKRVSRGSAKTLQVHCLFGPHAVDAKFRTRSWLQLEVVAPLDLLFLFSFPLPLPLSLGFFFSLFYFILFYFYFFSFLSLAWIPSPNGFSPFLLNSPMRYPIGGDCSGCWDWNWIRLAGLTESVISGDNISRITIN